MKPAEQIIDALKKALADLGIEGAKPTLERPADMAHGDWSTNVAFIANQWMVRDTRRSSRKHHLVSQSVTVDSGGYEFNSPLDWAKEIVKKLSKPDCVKNISIAGPGFINFTLEQEHFIDTLRQIAKNPEEYGRGDTFKKERVFIEYTQPNPFKEMHIGHLVNNIIGESVSRIIENAGAEVKRATYHGDIGLHVARAMWAMQQKNIGPSDITVELLGEMYAAGSVAYEENEEAKKAITTLNKIIYEQSDAGVNELYNIGRTISLEHFKKIYERLGSRFDYAFLESEAGAVGTKLVRDHITDGIFEESEGAVVFKGEQYGLHTRVFLNSAGLPTYEAKDLGLVPLKREKYDFTTSLVVTDVEQSSYFTVVKKAIELVFPELEGHVQHISHGRLRLTTGRVSSRKGGNPSAEGVLDELAESVQEKMGDREVGDIISASDTIAVAAIKYVVLRQAAGKHIIFDKDKSLSFEGDSGPYIQYTAVRARSVVAKAESAGIKSSFDIHPESVGLLERMLERFPEVTQRAAEEREPHHIATYLIELSSGFNSWYAHEQIINVDDALSPYRVALADAVSHVLARGLWLLGIRVPSAM